MSPEIPPLRREVAATKLVTEIVGLCRSDLEPPAFLKAFAQKLLEGLGGAEVAVWTLSGEELKLSCIAEATPKARSALALSVEDETRIIQEVFTTGKPFIFQGKQATSGKKAVFARLFAQGKPTGVIRLILPETLEPAEVDLRASQLALLLNYLDLFIELKGLRLASREETSLARLSGLAKSLHGSFNPKEVAYVAVNSARNLIQMDRACLGLPHGSEVELAAVSGISQFEKKSSAARVLTELMTGILQHGKGFCLNRGLQEGESLDVPYIEHLRDYLRTTGLKSLLAYPLSDEEGHLGVLMFEASKESAFTRNDLRVGDAFARQVQVALRTAQRFQSLPFLPMAVRLQGLARKIAAAKWEKIAVASVLVALAVYFIGFFKFPDMVRARAAIQPLSIHPVASRVEAPVKEVLVEEGQEVKKGEVLVRLLSEDFERYLAKALSEKEAYQKNIDRLRAEGKEADALIEEERLNATMEDIRLYEEAIRDTNIVSPANGVVLTPKLELLLGRKVRRGEQIIEVADLDRLLLEIGVREKDVSRVKTGQEVQVSLQALPGKELPPTVISNIRSRAEDSGGLNVFIAEATLANPEGILRPGMTGKARITVGKTTLAGLIRRRTLAFVRYHLF